MKKNMKLGDMVVTARGIERITDQIASDLYTTTVIVPKQVLLDCKAKWFDESKKSGKKGKKKKLKKSARRELERKLRIQIAADVEEKMLYMGTCLNEQNIILGIIRGCRQFTNSLCAVCTSSNCELKKENL